jgi:hypothetical protein
MSLTQAGGHRKYVGWYREFDQPTLFLLRDSIVQRWRCMTGDSTVGFGFSNVRCVDCRPDSSKGRGHSDPTWCDALSNRN